MLKNCPKRAGVFLSGLAAVLPVLAGGPAPAAAAERTGINLGVTSFFDGFSRVTPGCTLLVYLGHGNFRTFTGPDGSPIADAHLDASYLAPQLACNSNWKLFGGTLAGHIIAPLGNQSSDNGNFATNGAGPGDILTGLYIQFPPIVMNSTI